MFKGINKVMRAFMFWDFFINSGWGLLGPVFSIFLLQTIAVGNVAQGATIAGFATLCYWVTKSILQLPIGNYLDKNHGEIDDFWFFTIGTIVTGIIPFGYLFAHTAWQIYGLEIIHGIGMSMILPSSLGIFIRHADKGKEAYEAGLDSTFLGMGAGIAGAVGGIMAGYLGFQFIFILTGLLTFISVAFLFMVHKDMLPKLPNESGEFIMHKDLLKK